MDNNKKKTTNKIKERPLTVKEKTFCREYAKTGNGQQSAIKAGYSEKTARSKASQLLTKINIKNEIDRLLNTKEKKAIMDAQEVMEHFTAIARGEEKDQFNLDISASDRIKALVELAKRTVDLDNRIKGQPDSVVQVKLDWGAMEDDTDDGK